MNNDWLDIAVLEDYLDGKLDPKMMNRVEHEALDDPFVAEALAGLSAAPKSSLVSISLLQKQLHDRIAQQQISKKKSVITWQRLSIAAAAAVMFITAGIVFWMKQVNYHQMAARQPGKVEVVIAPLPVEKNVDSLPVVDNPSLNTELAAVKKSKVRAKRQTSVASIVSDSINVALASAYIQKSTDSVFIVSGKKVADAPVANVEQLLQGRVAGLKLKKETAQIHPINGWDHLYMYIAANNKFKDRPRIGKSVTLSFIIDKSGKPDQLKVLEGISENYDKEAVRLFSEGPKWEQPKVDGTRTTFKIDF